MRARILASEDRKWWTLGAVAFGLFIYSALQVAGAAFLPMTVMIILIAPIAGRATDRIGSRWLMTGGMVLTVRKHRAEVEPAAPLEAAA